MRRGPLRLLAAVFSAALAAFAAAAAEGLLPAPEQGAAVLLDEDDACSTATGAGEGCSPALSLRQLRGEKSAALSLQTAEHAAKVRAGSENSSLKLGADAGQGGGNGTKASTGDTIWDPALGDGSKESPGYRPWDPALAVASSGELFTFYMYRAVSGTVYPPINVNTASIGGVLWYLHHEVVIQYPRKFNIQRIVRYKVQTRATEPLLKLGMNFGPRTAFDSGECTGPFVCGRTKQLPPQPKFCAGGFNQKYEAHITALSGRPYESSYEYSKFGFHVGCNKLGEYPFPMFKVYYPNATWFSLPGPCPSKTWRNQTAECKAEEPGGACEGTPTGAGDCTFNYEYMGEISLDDLVGDVDELHAKGGREYDPVKDKGILFSWWDGINDTKANEKRIQAVQALFAEKYPNQTLDEEMPAPACDFNFGMFYKEFWMRDPFSGKCEDAEVGSDCYKSVQWVMTDGIHAHPEWYPGLTVNSTFQEFQRLLYAQGSAACQHRPCGKDEIGDGGNGTAVDAGNHSSIGDESNSTSPAPAPPPSPGSKCEDAVPNSTCWTTVRWVMSDGIYGHPDWYPGLTPKSTFRDFQRAIHTANPATCPFSPCKGPDCEDAAPGSDCYKTVEWAMSDGIYGHPDWYPGLTPNSTFKDFHRAIHTTNSVICPFSPCEGTSGPPSTNGTVADNSTSPAPAPPPSPGSECEDTVPNSTCWTNVRWAMSDGIYGHPDWYPGLTPNSTFRDFQRAIHTANPATCPFGPCEGTVGPSPTTAAPVPAPAPPPSSTPAPATECEDAQPGSVCYKSVTWAMTDGIYAAPGWFPGLTPKSTFKEFQREMHDRNKAVCPYPPCDDALKPAAPPETTPAPTPAPTPDPSSASVPEETAPVPTPAPHASPAWNPPWIPQ